MTAYRIQDRLSRDSNGKLSLELGCNYCSSGASWIYIDGDKITNKKCDDCRTKHIEFMKEKMANQSDH